MAKLRITALTDGMVLSSDALDRAGRLILPAGSVIDAAARTRLLMARVRKVAVRSFAGDSGEAEEEAPPQPDAPPVPDPQSDEAIMQERLLRLAHMFEPFKDDVLMRDLCRLAVQCARERLIGVHA